MGFREEGSREVDAGYPASLQAVLATDPALLTGRHQLAVSLCPHLPFSVCQVVCRRDVANVDVETLIVVVGDEVSHDLPNDNEKSPVTTIGNPHATGR